jgi:cell division protein FtsW (lipid II flippase)
MRNIRTTSALITFTALPILLGFMEIRSSVVHFQQETWPSHALFHVVMGLGALLAACVLILVLAWGPLRRGERWAWFAIGFTALTIHGFQLIGDLVTDGGLRNQQGGLASGSVLMSAIIVSMLMYAVALALSWSSTRPRQG